TAAILRVHASNFRIVGFTESPDLRDLARLAHERGALLLDDIGSGCLIDVRRFGLAYEPTVQDSIAAGADLTLFSGDKLLGRPEWGTPGRWWAAAACRRRACRQSCSPSPAKGRRSRSWPCAFAPGSRRLWRAWNTMPCCWTRARWRRRRTGRCLGRYGPSWWLKARAFEPRSMRLGYAGRGSGIHLTHA